MCYLISFIIIYQIGYVKNRFIGETIRSSYDVMDYTVEENIPGLLIFIDFEKAFDSVANRIFFLNVLMLSILA